MNNSVIHYDMQLIGGGNNLKYVKQLKLTGSFLKNTKEVRVRMNQRFFQDFQPNPVVIWNIEQK